MVVPIAIVGDAGVTTTRPTGIDVTVTCAVPVSPALVADIVTLPGATPDTSPLDETVAIALSEDENVTWLFGTTRPCESRTWAVSCEVAPCWTTTWAGVTTTALGGRAVTVTALAPDLPSLVAVMTAFPGDCAVTTPVDVTVAIPALLVDQSTTRPVSGLL